MHRPTIRRRRELQARLGTTQVALPPARELAIGWLDDKIAEGHAGNDPYDPPVFIVQADANEKVWARTVIELCGLYLSEVGGEFRLILEADVRERLGLDSAGAHVMPDVALASRSVDSGATAVMDAVFGADESRPQLHIVEPESQVH